MLFTVGQVGDFWYLYCVVLLNLLEVSLLIGTVTVSRALYYSSFEQRSEVGCWEVPPTEGGLDLWLAQAGN